MNEERPRPGNTTTDHEVIRSWVVDQGGTPAMVRRVGQPDEGDLVINFRDDGSDQPIVDISWADFFRRFDDRGLAFVQGEGDREYRLVKRHGQER